MDIKILVAAHKKYWMPDDDVYIPVHVGREGKEDLGYIGDNTGDNISAKNANYCELTGLYWAWKNLKCDYIGLCHYRRYFAGKNIRGNDVEKKKTVILKRQGYEKLLQEYDMILPVKRNYYIETVVVAVETSVSHKTYGKTVKRTYKLKAHDEENACQIGDKVKVMETRPLSKDKRWRVVEILEKADIK